MNTSMVWPISGRVLGVPALLLLSLGCGELPTSPDGTAMADAPLLSRGGGGRATGEYGATAEFYANEECRETESSVTAVEAVGPGGGATLDFTYSVLGVCGDAEGLWYYDLSTGGPAIIDPSDLWIHRGLKRARLDTEVEVFDEEGSVFMMVRVRTRWTRARDGSWEATLEITSDQITELYLTIPLPPAVEAELTRR